MASLLEPIHPLLNTQPTHGSSQGNQRARASSWLIICCLLFEAMTKLYKGAKFYNPPPPDKLLPINAPAMASSTT